MRFQIIAACAAFPVSLAAGAPMKKAKPAEAIYGNPETATLPYNVNSLNIVEKRGEEAYGKDSLRPNVK
ncbi:hypothetical protein PG993_009306 [Apiospora rasikravindrae]|uniref:Uncharacterized protein n=1 Tax=Apiospora rasikravindrae TaxID=990691 RepID=A0ABR1SKB1_9PEZI